MAMNLRAMCWNIAEGSQNGTTNGSLPELAAAIRSKNPDIVLLNEAIRWYWWKNGGVNQVAELARMAGFSYYQWVDTAILGVGGIGGGSKTVGVLSRLPLGPAEKLKLQGGDIWGAGWATLKTSVTIDNKVHHILSTRFDWGHRDDNIAAFRQTLDTIRALPPDEPVIFGGDLNVGIFRQENPDGTQRPAQQLLDFSNNSGLIEVLSGLNNAPVVRDDYLFFRGAYRASEMEITEPAINPSDHPWVFATLLSQDTPVTPVNNAAFVSQSVPASVSQGETRSVRITLTNTGTTTWAANAGFSLGSQAPRDNTRWGRSRVALPGIVRPGENVAINFDITSTVIGSMDFQWRMVKDGVEWFGAPTPLTKINVISTAEPARCEDLRLSIRTTQEAIDEAMGQFSGNPRADAQLRLKIDKLRSELRGLQNEARALGCAL